MYTILKCTEKLDLVCPSVRPNVPTDVLEIMLVLYHICPEGAFRDFMMDIWRHWESHFEFLHEPSFLNGTINASLRKDLLLELPGFYAMIIETGTMSFLVELLNLA